MVLQSLDGMGPLHGYGITAETQNCTRISGVIGRLLDLPARSK